VPGIFCVRSQIASSALSLDRNKASRLARCRVAREVFEQAGFGECADIIRGVGGPDDDLVTRIENVDLRTAARGDVVEDGREVCRADDQHQIAELAVAVLVDDGAHHPDVLLSNTVVVAAPVRVRMLVLSA